MNLFIDGDVFHWQIRGGISKMYRSILPIVSRKHPDIRYRIAVQGKLMAADIEELLPMMRRIPRVPSSWRPWRFWHRIRPIGNRMFFSGYARMARPDVFHSTFYTMAPLRMPSFCFVYDMTVEHYPRMFPDGYADANMARKREVIMKAARVLCISQHTRQDVVELLKVPEERCRVVYLSADLPSEAGNNDEIMKPPTPFFLYVGGYQAEYKNFNRLLEYLASRDTSGYDGVELVVVSSVAPTQAQLDRYQAVIGSSRLRFVTDCDDQQLGRLYRSCSALLYPSLYEGFGMPVLDALANGAPVVCSNSSSLPEVGGEHGYYFDPLSAAEFSAALRRALEHGRAPSYVERRKAWARTSSWEKTADAFAETCYEVAGM